MRSISSRLSWLSNPSNCSSASVSSVGVCAGHIDSSRSISSSTMASEILPPGAKVAILMMARLRPRKLHCQTASVETANFRNRSRASRLKVTRTPLRRE